MRKTLALLVGAVVLSLFVPVALHAQAVYVENVLPHPEWRRYYWQMEKCTQLKGDYTKIKWQVTPKPWKDHVSSTDVPGDSSWTFGLWMKLRGTDTTKILLNSTDWHIEGYIKHEMLHDILWRSGWRGPKPQRDVHDSVNVRAHHPVEWQGRKLFEHCALTNISQIRKEHSQKQSPYRKVYVP